MNQRFLSRNSKERKNTSTSQRIGSYALGGVAGAMCADIIDDVQIAVRPVVVPQANPGTYRLHIRRVPAPHAEAISVLECWQHLQDFAGPRPTDCRIVFPDFPVAEHQHTLGELRDVLFVGHQNNRQSLVI